jgi:hypothetical protein
VTAYWAWAADGSAMHAWPLTAEQVQQAKAEETAHTTICGWISGIGERPVQPPHIEAERNHCSACWSALHPPANTPFIAALVLSDIPRADTQWRRSG